MLHWLYLSLIENAPYLNILKYITFRSACALATALLIFFVFGSRMILLLKAIQEHGQPIRSDGPESHFSKKGTPTMGGLGIIFSIIISTLLWADLRNAFVWITLFVLLSFGLLGFLDDYMKIKYKNSKGVSGKKKLVWQFLTSFVAIYFIMLADNGNDVTGLAFPFVKNYLLELGLFYFVFGAIVITGASNAVNLTDGLDGLAIGPIIISSACFALISYLVGSKVFAEYLQLNYVPNSGELMVVCAAIIGSGLGFLWYNAPPAQVFMGDVGSLALGGVIGVMSVITKHEIVLAIIGGLFVIEAVSVILQVYYFKATKKRLFRMAPIHHHFEKIGWSETKVVIRFWIIAIIFALIGLSTLKLR